MLFFVAYLNAKDIAIVYFYEAGNMNIKGIVNLKDFNLVEKNKVF